MNQYRHFRMLFGILCGLLTGTSNAAQPAGLGSLFDRSTNTRDEFLPVEKAFRISAVALGPEQVRVTWVIAPGYYLYQKRLKFTATTPGVKLGSPQLPKGESHTDEYFGAQTVYRQVLQASISVSRTNPSAGAVTLAVGYQGCADAGLCYPPQTTPLTIELPHKAP